VGVARNATSRRASKSGTVTQVAEAPRRRPAESGLPSSGRAAGESDQGSEAVSASKTKPRVLLDWCWWLPVVAYHAAATRGRGMMRYRQEQARLGKRRLVK